MPDRKLNVLFTLLLPHEPGAFDDGEPALRCHTPTAWYDGLTQADRATPTERRFLSTMSPVETVMT